MRLSSAAALALALAVALAACPGARGAGAGGDDDDNESGVVVPMTGPPTKGGGATARRAEADDVEDEDGGEAPAEKYDVDDEAPAGKAKAVAVEHSDPVKKVTLSFSGGGNRAALSALTSLEFIEDVFGFDRVDSINGLSGGSWGMTIHAMTKGSKSTDRVRKQAKIDEAIRRNTQGSIFRRLQKAKTHKWGYMRRFIPARAAGRFRSPLYKAWRDDIAHEVVMSEEINTMRWGDMGRRFAENHGKAVPLCVFVSDGKKMKNPARKCKQCSDSKMMKCWGHVRSQAEKPPVFPEVSEYDLEKPGTRIANVKLEQGIHAVDVIALSSSAWTLFAKPLAIRPGGGNKIAIRGSDAGIDVNLGVDPAWMRPSAQREAILLFDATDTGRTLIHGQKPTTQQLVKLARKWKRDFALPLAEVAPVVLSTPKLNADGTRASPEQQKANAAKGAAHKVTTHIHRVWLTPGGEKAGGPGTRRPEIYHVYLQGKGKPNALIQKLPLMRNGVWVNPYTKKHFDLIQTEYLGFLHSHVAPVLEELGVFARKPEAAV